MIDRMNGLTASVTVCSWLWDTSAIFRDVKTFTDVLITRFYFMPFLKRGTREDKVLLTEVE